MTTSIKCIQFCPKILLGPSFAEEMTDQALTPIINRAQCGKCSLTCIRKSWVSPTITVDYQNWLAQLKHGSFML